MLEDNQNIDNIFSDALCDYQEQAPPYSWNNIQDDLNAIKHKRRLIWLKRTGVIGILLAAFWLGYWSSTYDLYHKSESLYIKTIARNANKTSKYYLQNTSSILIDDVIVKAKYLGNNNADADKISNKINDNIDKKYTVVKAGNTDKQITDKNHQQTKNRKDNQLLTNALLCKDESRHNDGSFFIDNAKDISNWSVGAKFSPIYSINMFKTISEDGNYSPAIRDGFSNVSSEVLSAYTGGINVNYRISKRISIESGLFYSTSKQLSTMRGMSASLAHQPNANAHNTNDLNNQPMSAAAQSPFQYTTISYTQNLDYLELPFSIRYRVIDRKFSLDLSGGMSTNFLIKNNISSQMETDFLQYDANSTLYNAKFSLGLNYRFLQQIQFNLEPTLQYSINPTSHSFLKEYPYSFAIFAGFIYNLK